MTASFQCFCSLFSFLFYFIISLNWAPFSCFIVMKYMGLNGHPSSVAPLAAYVGGGVAPWSYTMLVYNPLTCSLS